jgi:hypothetical protein
MHRTRTQDRGQTADRDSEQARTRLDRARNQQDVAGVNQTRRTTLVGWDIEQVLRRPHIGVIRDLRYDLSRRRRSNHVTEADRSR